MPRENLLSSLFRSTATVSPGLLLTHYLVLPRRLLDLEDLSRLS